MFKRKEKNITTTAPINLTTINEPMTVITDHKLRTLMVTSAMLGEGKSTVSGNLAVEYAKEGRQASLTGRC